MSRSRLAVLGAGPWGLNHVRVVAAEARCELAAIVDRDPAALQAARSLAPRATLLTSADAVLGDPTIDAVVIATPAITHVALANAALAAGKHVLVEKPVALSLADARSVAEVAARTKTVVLVGHLMVMHPAVVRMRELVQAGTLGTVHTIRATRANQGRIRLDENVLWSFGPHDLSMLDYLLGKAPASVAARGHSVQETGIEDVVVLTLRYASGELAHLHLSWLHPRKERTLAIVGARAMAELDDMAPEKLRIYRSDGGIDGVPVALAEPLQLQLAHFLDCIDGRAIPRADLTSAIRITATLEAAQRSLAMDGAPVAVHPVPS